MHGAGGDYGRRAARHRDILPAQARAETCTGALEQQPRTHTRGRRCGAVERDIEAVGTQGQQAVAMQILSSAEAPAQRAAQAVGVRLKSEIQVQLAQRRRGLCERQMQLQTQPRQPAVQRAGERSDGGRGSTQLAVETCRCSACIELATQACQPRLLHLQFHRQSIKRAT